jgi:glycosyltransferase involved in cell wall biosynthesis
MHVLSVAVAFPSPDIPHRAPFIREQVRLLCERKEIERVTVLSPTVAVPAVMRGLRRIADQVSMPDSYNLVEGRCDVLFPRYYKLPGDWFLNSWTVAQWRRIIDRTVLKFARTKPISIIHAHNGTVSAWASICVAKKHGIPCVVTYHGSEVHQTLARKLKGWELGRDSFQYADLNLPVSRSLETVLRSNATPSGPCEVLFLGVDQSRFFPPVARPVNRHVLYVGWLAEAKGVFDLLAAWSKVKSAYPDALLTLVGSDRTAGLFSRRADAMGLADSIRVTGPLPAAKIAGLMQVSRFLCLPSHGEGMPTCIMEALSSGMPVVATRVGGIPEIVKHEVTGLLVEKGDIDGLTHALTMLLTDLERCRRMELAALQFARENLNARKTVDRLVHHYTELVAARHRRVQFHPEALPSPCTTVR